MTNDLQIQRWPLDRLVPYARNARTHSDGQVAQIAASIAEFGFVNPVLIDERGEIIAGHGRVLAARTCASPTRPTTSTTATRPRTNCAATSAAS